MSTRSDNLRENRRIILLRLLDGKDPEVLLNFERTPYDLPQVAVVRSERIAEQLTAGIKEICNIDAVSISALEVRFTRPCGEPEIAEQLAHEFGIDPYYASKSRAKSSNSVAWASNGETAFYFLAARPRPSTESDDRDTTCCSLLTISSAETGRENQYPWIWSQR